MGALVTEWLHLFVRWMHVLAGIMWIGSSIFFNWLDSHLEKTGKPGVEGELWMVHSRRLLPGREEAGRARARCRKTLHWFKWEAGFTWLTGVFLLGARLLRGRRRSPGTSRSPAPADRAST